MSSPSRNPVLGVGNVDVACLMMRMATSASSCTSLSGISLLVSAIVAGVFGESLACGGSDGGRWPVVVVVVIENQCQALLFVVTALIHSARCLVSESSYGVLLHRVEMPQLARDWLT